MASIDQTSQSLFRQCDANSGTDAIVITSHRRGVLFSNTSARQRFGLSRRRTSPSANHASAERCTVDPAASIRSPQAVTLIALRWPIVDGEPTGPWWELTLVPACRGD
jgi:hypothetical protein